ncbi:ejaculatory bulb-specific protein 3-like [Anabrus simplex]|uniref:ejaculatory bulb-specific protein 3-like n=1 Tax=Anabrus simplex TaxID=316456 RepID=UPI0035A2A4BC
MRRAVFVCVVLAVAASVLADEKYSDKYDNVDLDEILTNDRLLTKYKDCLVSNSDNGCTEDAKALKRVLSEALSNDCAKCTEKQKSGAQKAIKFLHANKPEVWKELEAKYDPTGQFLQRHPHLAN